MAEYRTPFETEDDACRYQWRRLTAQMLRQQTPRSLLADEVLALEPIQLIGPTAPKESEDTVTTLTNVLTSAAADLLRAGLSTSDLDALMDQAFADSKPLRRAS